METIVVIFENPLPGKNVKGKELTSESSIKSMVLDSYTQLIPVQNQKIIQGNVQHIEVQMVTKYHVMIPYKNYNASLPYWVDCTECVIESELDNGIVVPVVPIPLELDEDTIEILKSKENIEQFKPGNLPNISLE